MNKYKKTLYDTALFAVSSFASKVLVFFMLPLYTNILSTEEYAVVDMFTVTVNLLVPILTLALSEASLRFSLEKGVLKNEVLTTVMLSAVISTAVVFCLLPFLKRFEESFQTYRLYFVSLFFLVALYNGLSNYLRGCNRLKVFAIQGVVHTGLLIGCNLLFLLVFHMGLVGYLIALIVAYTGTIIFILIFGKCIPELCRLHLNTGLLKQMLRYSIPMVPTIIAWWIMQTSDKYMIIAKLGMSASGLYSVSYKIPLILSACSSLFLQAWQLSAISNYQQEDNEDFVSNFYRFYHCVSIVICGAMLLLSPVLGKFLFAKDFFPAWRYTPILLIAYVFSGLSGFLASIFSSAKKTKMLFWSTGIGAALNIGLNIFLIDIFGIQGAAYTTMIGFFATWAIRLYFSEKLVKIKIPHIRNVIMYVVLLATAIVMYKEIPYGLLIASILFGIIIALNLPDITFLFRAIVGSRLKNSHEKTAMNAEVIEMLQDRSLSDENRAFLMICKNAIEANPKRLPSDTEIDYGRFLSFAQDQMISVMAYRGIQNSGLSIPDEWKSSFEDNKDKALYKFLIQSIELKKITEELETAGVPFMVLKGFVIRDIYPSEELRESCDIDILFLSGEENIRQVMRNLGYSYRKKNDTLDYVKKPSTYVEFHTQIFQNTREYAKYYSEMTHHCRTADGYQNRYYMSREDELAYLYAHMAKHLSNGGCGIRMVFDIYLYRKKYSNELDVPHLEHIISKLKLTTFYEKINHLIAVWFEEEEETAIDSILSEYICNGKAFGMGKNANAMQIVRAGGRAKRKIKLIRTVAFPTYDKMCEKYPTLRRLPVLFPVFWVFRALKVFSLKNKCFARKILQSGRVSNEDISAAEHLLSELDILKN